MKRNILITGASRGIGRYLAEYYSKMEYSVAGCSRSETDFKHKYYEHFTVDISKKQEILNLFASIRKKYSKLDILINNAVINTKISPFLLVSNDNIESAFKVNYFGTFFMCQEAVKLMMKNKIGRIINFSSMAEKHNVAGESVYTSSKAAITAFSRVIAKEIYNYGITCNVIAPSAIETDLMKAVNHEELKKVLDRNAVKEIGKMTDISNVIDFLIRPESSAITGQIIYLGGV